jgi:hypothetical protein
MTKDEAFAKNLELGFEFDRYLIEHPKFAEKIPFDALVVLLPKYDQKLREYNLRIAQKNREPEQSVVYVEIDGVKPQKSRLLRPKLKLAENGRNSRKPMIKKRLYSKAA